MGTPRAAARCISSGCRPLASAVTKSSRTPLPLSAALTRASRTACGPSAKNARSCTRNDRFSSRFAALTRGDRTSVNSLRDPTTSADTRSGGGLGARDRPSHGECLAGDLDQHRERRVVRHRELGKVLAVDLDARRLQPLDQAVVGHVVQPRGRVDALDPQPAEVALARAPVAVAVGRRMQQLLFGLAVEPRALAAVPTCPLEDNPALLLGVNRPLHACHLETPCSVRRPTGPAHRTTSRANYRPSSFLARLVSGADATTSLLRRRVKVDGLCSR